MSDLQLSLLVIGAVVVCAVYLYNWLQERSYRRSVGQAFGAVHDDVLLKAGVESARTDGRLEPLIVPEAADAGEPDPPLAPRRDSREAGAGFDPLLDYVAGIEAGSPIAESVIGELASKTAAFGKPSRMAGFDSQAGTWGEIGRGEGGLYLRLQVALQLVNRSGPVSAAQLSAFCDVVKGCSDRIAATVVFPDANSALKRARDLDSFCAGVDIAVGVNVVAEGGSMFSGARIRELAQAAGFRLEPDGVFHFFDSNHRTLFTLDNHEPAPFLPERIRALSTKGLTLLLDVPRAAAGGDVLDRMIGIANEFAATLGGQLVDDNRAVLTETGLAAIREQVRTIQAAMEARGIPAGSPRALRLFSG